MQFLFFAVIFFMLKIRTVSNSRIVPLPCRNCHYFVFREKSDEGDIGFTARGGENRAEKRQRGRHRGRNKAWNK
jgi:hypothetical protein